VGKGRADTCVTQLASLNEYVHVHVVKAAIDEKLIASGAFSVVVATDRTYSEQVALNDLCRKYGVKFIGADVRGVLTYTFVDLGPVCTHSILSVCLH
jgi:molybdopterin/thiamine biosynthesis adenylyltransferase